MSPTIRVFSTWLLAAFVLVANAQCQTTRPAHIAMQRTRTSPGDLEIGGDLAGVPHGETRFVSYADLLRLSQETFTADFGHPIHVSGVLLERLPAALGAAAQSSMITALCTDFYKANYPADYLRTHHPVLVLSIDGQPPSHWPNTSMGPYLVAHANFTPSFHVLSHADEPQVPWGVARIDFRRETDVYADIQPTGPHASDEIVQQGFTIARQNCFRCHNAGDEGGTKAGRTWQIIARDSVTAPEFFDNYVRTPQKVNPSSKMDGSPGYDAATLNALRAYFKTFAEVAPK